DPILVGRSEHKLQALAEKHGIERWSTNLDQCLANPHDTIYFDAQTTTRRAAGVRAAIAAGKHIYCEKPIATDVETALDLARRARGRREKRRGARQTLAARAAQAQASGRRRLLRAHPVGARRVRLLGVRGRLAERPAAFLELPQAGRRRDHRRHAVPLALRARQ